MLSHSEPNWVVERTHCVVAAFPGAAFTDRHSRRVVVIVVVPFVCLLSSISRFALPSPHNPTLYRHRGCELPRRSAPHRPPLLYSHSRNKYKPAPENDITRLTNKVFCFISGNARILSVHSWMYRFYEQVRRNNCFDLKGRSVDVTCFLRGTF